MTGARPADARRRALQALIPVDDHELAVRAMRRSGYNDLGPPCFSEPLTILCRALDREAELTARGRHVARRTLVTALAHRSRVAYELSCDRPERSVERPVFVLGLPGSGVGRLHAALSTHPELIAMSAQEDTTIMASCAASVTFDANWHVPTWAEWFDSADLSGAYRWMRAVLGLAPPGRRRLVCSGEHLEHLVTLSATFPDATVVVAHGDTAEVTRRRVEDVVGLRGRWSRHVDLDVVARYTAWRTEKMIERSRDRRPPSSGSIVDVDLGELDADLEGCVERIEACAGLGPRRP